MLVVAISVAVVHLHVAHVWVAQCALADAWFVVRGLGLHPLAESGQAAVGREAIWEGILPSVGMPL
eukprot:8366127-Heterocapsa_arctica.AAC.1